MAALFLLPGHGDCSFVRRLSAQHKGIISHERDLLHTYPFPLYLAELLSFIPRPITLLGDERRISAGKSPSERGIAMKTGHFVYGPCNSRRLGRSLGVDLIPHKTCSLDCVYCECGPTTCLTLARREYRPTAEVIQALDDILGYEPPLDYITFAGSGEPTLHRDIGLIIRHLKNRYSQQKVAVITNSTLLQDSQVVQDLLAADLIVPSLDAVTPEIFAQINRPAPGLTPDGIIQGIRDLRRQFTGQLWLEIFFVPGLNDTDSEVENFRRVLADIACDKVQLNKLDRPGAVDWMQPADPQRLKQIAACLPGAEIVW